MTLTQQLEQQLDVGKRASRILDSGMREYMTTREGQLISEMLAWFRDNKTNADPHVGVRFIAALFALRSMGIDLEHDAKKGRDATAALVIKSTEAA